MVHNTQTGGPGCDRILHRSTDLQNKERESLAIIHRIGEHLLVLIKDADKHGVVSTQRVTNHGRKP